MTLVKAKHRDARVLGETMTHLMRTSWIGLFVLAAGLLAGCGGSGENQVLPQEDAAVPQTDAAVPDDVGPPPLAVTVFAGDPYVAGGGTTPLSGATVAADLPSGERRELTTDGDGRAIFDEVDWAQGTATLTAWAADRRLVSVIGLAQSDGAQKVWLFPLGDPARVQVRGTVTNADDPANALFVSSSVDTPTSHTLHAVSFWLNVRTGVPFSLIGFEHVLEETTVRDWTRVDHEAVTANASGLVMDFSQKLTPVVVHGTVMLPTNPDSVFLDPVSPVITVSTLESAQGVILGLATQMDLNGDATGVDYTGESVPFEGATIVTTYALNSKVGMDVQHPRLAEIRVPGHPEDGAVISGFLDELHVTAPASLAVAVPLSTPFGWTTPDVTTETVLTLFNDEVPVWTVRSRPGVSGFTVPEPPSGTSAADLLGVSRPSGQFSVVADFDPKLNLHRRSTTSARFDLTF
jgi:hypothetical protein